eukprot:TRINITY_DN12147_c0_g2_i4.p1 TRINITY_DN12147_c0_g2~~TRINITY_DN12147_c0_g2_i4.p1  ORF type:complete len:291 (+),score=73.77 TRINITY_DN12147_c0_g2_i4:368-1240(+)
MGTDVGGVYRSLNGGKNWSVAMVGWWSRGGAAFAIDPKNSSHVIGLGGNSEAESDADGLYISTDKAASWSQTQNISQATSSLLGAAVVIDSSSYDSHRGWSLIAYFSSATNGSKDKMLPEAASLSRDTSKPHTNCNLCKQVQTDPTFERWMQQHCPSRGANFCCVCQQQLQYNGPAPDCLASHCANCHTNYNTYVQRCRQQFGMQVVAASDTTPTTPALKPTVKFLVTNELEVFENSTIKAIQLMSKANVQLDRARTVTVTITEAKFKMMLACMLLNSKTILTSCLENDL